MTSGVQATCLSVIARAGVALRGVPAGLTGAWLGIKWQDHGSSTSHPSGNFWQFSFQTANPAAILPAPAPPPPPPPPCANPERKRRKSPRGD